MIIKSILDNDLYSLTQQNAILKYKPNVDVEFGFINRNINFKFNDEFASNFKKEIYSLSKLYLQDIERVYLKSNFRFFDDQYIEYLYNFRMNPDSIKWDIDSDSNLNLTINDKWERAMMLEVPLLSLISELYFKYCDNTWVKTKGNTIEEQYSLADKKGRLLGKNKVPFIEFGTRRRRSYEVQDNVLRALSYSKTFLGTSNVHLSMKHKVKAFGTQSHQWIMGISALESLRHANRFAMDIWSDIYKGDLGIVLTDTFGTNSFFCDFDLKKAKLYDGVRHDSANPFEFGEKVIINYESLGIDPLTKSIVFSDSLNCDKAIKLKNYFKNRINTSYGIGTHFTNSFNHSDPLNIVIKLKKVNGIPVVKLSDDPGKATGDENALRMAEYVFYNKNLI